MKWNIRANTALITNFLSDYRHTKVYFFPNSGNAGDSLISVATIQLLRRLGIAFDVVDLRFDATNKIVFLGGGGNFVPLYDTIRNAFTRFDNAKQLVLFPHTIRGNEDLIGRLGRNVTLFCRDVPSYLHLQNTKTAAEYYLAHDMAFHLDVEMLTSGEEATDYKESYADSLKKHGLDFEQPAVKSQAYFTRRDVESTGRLKRCDADISEIFAFGVWPGHADRSSWCFMRALQSVDRVITDRLHVAIGSALIGRSCVLHDNSYGKNQAVFQHSLRNYTEAVRFADE